jgi:ABC-2 type transport system permease protein
VAESSRARSRFLPLVGNEFVKPMQRISTFVMFGIVVLVGFLGILVNSLMQTSVTTDQNGAPLTDRQVLTARIQQEKEVLQRQQENLASLLDKGSYESVIGDDTPQPTLAPDELAEAIASTRLGITSAQQDLAIDQYRLDHDLPQSEDSTALGYASSQGWIVQLLTVFAVVLASVGVASEFTGGTIRLLLTRPFRRWKILLSKYVGVYLVTLCLLVLSVGIALLGGVLLRGPTSSPYLTVVRGAVHATPMFWIVLVRFALASVELLLISTMAFMIASVFRTSGLSIGLSLFLMFIGGTVTSAMAALGKTYDIAILRTLAKFSMFAYTDLSPYVLRRDLFSTAPEVPLAFAAAVLAVYYLVFVSIAFLGFSKRDVA